LVVVGEALLLPFALPILPVDTLAKGPGEGNLNKDLSATVTQPSVVAAAGSCAGAGVPVSVVVGWTGRTIG
jgi:hypothetical protein